MGEYMRYILLLLVLLVSSFTYAQEDSESLDTENIEEVVTSALRKETALQDTGLAVTVLTASDIESKNLKEFYDFQFNVPGVLFNKGNFSGAAIQIRGMTNYAIGGSFAAVATPRQDDINMGNLQMAQNELFDLASFEVLRGPQGTLYGGNNPGGTFLMKSIDPGDDTDCPNPPPGPASVTGSAMPVIARRGSHSMAWPAIAWRGSARHGMAWHGMKFM